MPQHNRSAGELAEFRQQHDELPKPKKPPVLRRQPRGSALRAAVADQPLMRLGAKVVAPIASLNPLMLFAPGAAGAAGKVASMVETGTEAGQVVGAILGGTGRFAGPIRQTGGLVLRALGVGDILGFREGNPVSGIREAVSAHASARTAAFKEDPKGFFLREFLGRGN